MARHEVLWDLTNQQAHDAFVRYRDRGWTVVSYSLSGTPAAPRHAFVWSTTEDGPRQRMTTSPRDWATFEETLVTQASQGYYPSHVGAFSDAVQGTAPTATWSAIFTRSTSPNRPVFVPPTRWSVDVGMSFLREIDRPGLFVLSCGVLGLPSEQDFRDAGVRFAEADANHGVARGLRMYACLWPEPVAGAGWAVHLTPLLPNRKPHALQVIQHGGWTARWEVQALSVQAHPREVHHTRSAPGLGALALSLWRDERFEPWPVPNPFGTTNLFKVQTFTPDQMWQGIMGPREDLDQRPLSISVVGSGIDARTTVSFGRAGSEDPLPRQWFERGPGDVGPAHVPAARRVEVGAAEWDLSRFERSLARQRSAARALREDRTADHAVSPVLQPEWALQLARSGRAPRGYLPDDHDAIVRQGPQIELHPLDGWMRSRMFRSGARHGQLVVVRRGRLVHAKAYTWAEQGYPICTLDHAMRIASCAKMITAMQVIKRLVPSTPRGLETPITHASLLDIPPHQGHPLLHDVTLRQLLLHNQGWEDEGFYVSSWMPDRPGGVWSEWLMVGLANATATDVLTRASPGTLRAYLVKQRDDYYAVAPGEPCRFAYSNQGFMTLGEALGNALGSGWHDYEQALIDDLLRPSGVDPSAAPPRCDQASAYGCG